MQRDQIHTVSFAPDQDLGIDWNSLLNSIGTGEFELALTKLLSTLVGPRACAASRHEASGRTMACEGACSIIGLRAVGTLAAIVRDHIDTTTRVRDFAEPLSCLGTIEDCLSETTALPTREVEVCSRILLGLSSAGIAIDLALSETTVKTYRKRAYQRLSIGSERELITLYLRTWASWQRLREQPRPPIRAQLQDHLSP